MVPDKYLKNNGNILAHSTNIQLLFQNWGLNHLFELFFSILLSTQFVLRALAKLPQPLGFLLSRVDFVPQLLLEGHLLHFNCAVLLLGNLQPAKTANTEQQVFWISLGNRASGSISSWKVLAGTCVRVKWTPVTFVQARNWNMTGNNG